VPRATRLAICCTLGVAALACHPPAGARRPPGNVGGNASAKTTPDDVLGLGGAPTLRFTGTKVGETGSTAARVDVKVRDVLRGGGQTAWIVENWPVTDVWDPSELLAVIVLRDATYHLALVAPADLAAARAALAAGKLPDGAEAWFHVPLRDGDELCPDPEIRYCWTVEADAARFRVTYRTNPDDLTYVIDPKRGLVGFEYHHHGTPNELVLERAR